MNFEYESSLSSSSPSQFSAPSTPVTPPNPNSSQPQLRLSHSHKRKAGRKKFRETRHPVYRGVRQRNGNKWVCEVREPNKKTRIWLGTYPTPEMAARAHDVAAIALRGTSAMLNFPDLASLLPVARSSSATDIRAAASKAAEAFKPNTSSNNFCSETRCENLDSTADPCLVEEKSHEALSSCSKVNMHGVEATDPDKSSCTKYDESETMFVDEEALYNMPGLLDSMAEGLLITPPSMKRAMDWNDIGCEIDMTLWTD